MYSSGSKLQSQRMLTLSTPRLFERRQSQKMQAQMMDSEWMS
jgi:hypothetical protein